MGIEPTPPAWKAGALPLSYTRKIKLKKTSTRISTTTKLSIASPDHLLSYQVKIWLSAMPKINIIKPTNMAGAGFEPAKAEPPDLQSGPFGHSGIPPKTIFAIKKLAVGFEPTTTGLQNRYSAVELR